MDQFNAGYKKNFLGKDYLLKPPVLNAQQKRDLIKYDGHKYVLDYIHYSVVMSRVRRFAYFPQKPGLMKSGDDDIFEHLKFRGGSRRIQSVKRDLSCC
jgi:hypothetical protein